MRFKTTNVPVILSHEIFSSKGELLGAETTRVKMEWFVGDSTPPKDDAAREFVKILAANKFDLVGLESNSNDPVSKLMRKSVELKLTDVEEELDDITYYRIKKMQLEVK